MSKQGFTLIEVLIVTAIMGLVLSFGMTIDLNTFKGDVLESEVATIVSILERARSQAMANIYDNSHGFCYIKPNYVIFTGETCTISNSELIPANTEIASNISSVFPTQIVFERLSGRTNTSEILVSHGLQEEYIQINEEGRISW